MQLRQTELFGVLDQHQGRVRHVHADFNDRSGDQDLDPIFAKCVHHSLLFPGLQTPVQQSDLKGREIILQLLSFLRDGLERAPVAFLDTRVNHISLSALLEFAANELHHLR